MQLVDTHCHIHDSEFLQKFDQTTEQLLDAATKAGVSTLVCVGTDVKSSNEAVSVATRYDQCRASVAIHPHEAEKLSIESIKKQVEELDDCISKNKHIIAVGECGLDYFYHQSADVKDRQKVLFRLQIELALKHDLPLIFHIRDAFADFFSIVDEYEGIRGVVHSFTSTVEDMQSCVERGLFVGLNGIMTFTRDTGQLTAAKQVPLSHLLLETDAPFLTPKPFRGKVCKPEHIVHTAAFLSELRGETIEELAAQTSRNAKRLFTM